MEVELKVSSRVLFESQYDIRMNEGVEVQTGQVLTPKILPGKRMRRGSEIFLSPALGSSPVVQWLPLRLGHRSERVQVLVVGAPQASSAGHYAQLEHFFATFHIHIDRYIHNGCRSSKVIRHRIFASAFGIRRTHVVDAVAYLRVWS